MGKNADDSDPDSSGPPTLPSTPARLRSVPSSQARFPVLIGCMVGLLIAGGTATLQADTLTKIRQSGRLVYGSDKEGGGPYAYPDPDSPREVTGFEVELMRE